MTLASEEMEWYKDHRLEIEAIINDDNAINKYLKNWWNGYPEDYYKDLYKYVRIAELDRIEFFRIVFYIFYKYRGINSFHTSSSNDSGDDVYTTLDLAFIYIMEVY